MSEKKILVSISAAIVTVLLMYLDSKIRKVEKEKSEYIKLFITVSCITYFVLVYFSTQTKQILKETINVGPATW